MQRKRRAAGISHGRSPSSAHRCTNSSIVARRVESSASAFTSLRSQSRSTSTSWPSRSASSSRSRERRSADASCSARRRSVVAPSRLVCQISPFGIRSSIASASMPSSSSRSPASTRLPAPPPKVHQRQRPSGSSWRGGGLFVDGVHHHRHHALVARDGLLHLVNELVPGVNVAAEEYLATAPRGVERDEHVLHFGGQAARSLRIETSVRMARRGLRLGAGSR